MNNVSYNVLQHTTKWVTKRKPVHKKEQGINIPILLGRLVARLHPCLLLSTVNVITTVHVVKYIQKLPHKADCPIILNIHLINGLQRESQKKKRESNSLFVLIMMLSGMQEHNSLQRNLQSQLLFVLMLFSYVFGFKWFNNKEQGLFPLLY